MRAAQEGFVADGVHTVADDGRGKGGAALEGRIANGADASRDVDGLQCRATIEGLVVDSLDCAGNSDAGNFSTALEASHADIRASLLDGDIF